MGGPSGLNCRRSASASLTLQSLHSAIDGEAFAQQQCRGASVQKLTGRQGNKKADAATRRPSIIPYVALLHAGDELDRALLCAFAGRPGVANLVRGHRQT